MLMADVKAMFHQIRVPAEDSATSSLRCAYFELRKCPVDNERHFGPSAFNVMLHHFYVDDCLVSVSSEQEVVSLCQELGALCAEGGFKQHTQFFGLFPCNSSEPKKQRIWI